MSKNYYETLIESIEKMIAEGAIEKALSKINEELSMPYVPQDTLNKLESLNAQVQSLLPKRESAIILKEEQIIPYLKKDDESAMAAMQFLAASNIRNFLHIIKEALNDTQINHIMKAILIELMVDQQVDETIVYLDNGPMTINTGQLQPVLRQPYVLKTYCILSEMIKQNPSFLQQCSLVLSNAAYDFYPKRVDDTQLNNLAFSIIRYVCDAYDNSQLWEYYRNEYNIDENVLQTFAF